MVGLAIEERRRQLGQSLRYAIGVLECMRCLRAESGLNDASWLERDGTRNVVFAGDFNWSEQRSKGKGSKKVSQEGDGEMTPFLNERWFDAWTTLNSNDPGYTYDGVSNGMLMNKFQERCDNALFFQGGRKETQRRWILMEEVSKPAFCSTALTAFYASWKTGAPMPCGGWGWGRFKIRRGSTRSACTMASKRSSPFGPPTTLASCSG